MLRTIIEDDLGTLTNDKFAEVLDYVATDIKINRIGFGKRTSLAKATQIALISFGVMKRGNKCEYRAN